MRLPGATVETRQISTLDVREIATYEAFVYALPEDDLDSQLLRQLLGRLEVDEVLVRLPEWLAGGDFAEGAPPTAIIGRIERDTQRAILLAESAAARPLMKLAHRIHQLEGIEGDQDRDESFDEWLAEHRQSFENRNDVPTLADEWLPKSQLQTVVRWRV